MWYFVIFKQLASYLASYILGIKQPLSGNSGISLTNILAREYFISFVIYLHCPWFLFLLESFKIISPATMDVIPFKFAELNAVH